MRFFIVFIYTYFYSLYSFLTTDFTDHIYSLPDRDFFHVLAIECVGDVHAGEVGTDLDGITWLDGEGCHRDTSGGDDADILGGLPLDDNRILWCCTEMNSKADIDKAVAVVKEV